jgi:D-threo-aldose 1-dehydrogenase
MVKTMHRREPIRTAPPATQGFAMQPLPTTSIASQLGMGCAEIGNLHRAISEPEAYAVLEAARVAGITLFDTAPGYGNGLSELRVGAFLRDHPGEGLTCSTKVGRYLVPGSGSGIRDFFAAPLPFEGRFDYSYDGVMRSFEQSLLRLGVTAVDCLFVHELDASNHGDALETHCRALLGGGLRALDELRSAGHTRQIGLAVNQPDVGARLLGGAAFDVALLASRYTLIDQSGLDEFLPLALERDVEVIAGGVFNSGILATGAAPGARYDYVEADAAVAAQVAAIEAVCWRHSVPLAAVALQFTLAHPAITTVLIGTSRPERIGENMAALACAIPEALWNELADLGSPRANALVH